ncbi:hypothetical protein BVI1335_520009 [Burkholderia vietnamiensis]|nr:hypothetical protein BVI1335_520009 [Burkholderia vietnamiensis]
MRSAADARKARHRFERVEFDVIAHVALARVGERLPVPCVDAALRRRRVMEAPAPLARAHLRVELRQVPAPRGLRAQRGERLRRFGQAGQVHALVRIVGEVVQLVGVGRALHVLPVAAANHHDRRHRAFGEIFAERDVVRRRAAQLRHEARAVDRVRPAAGRRHTGEVHQRRQQVEVRHRRAHARRVEALRRMHDQRHAAAAFEERHLVPEPALAEHVAVVGRDDHDRVVGEAALLERGEHAGELRVDVRGRAVVCAAGGANLRIGGRRTVVLADEAQPLRMRIALLGVEPHRRHVDLVVAVQVPVFARDRIRIVRMRQRHDHAERPCVVAGRTLARDVEQLLAGRERHFVVEVELIGAHARPGVEHRAHVVIPARPLGRVVPVGHPAEVGRIDVGREPLLEAVQLVGAAEVHFPGQHRPVTTRAQVVREGQRLRGQFGGVIVGADTRRQLAGQQREARRRAQRARAVRGVEHHALRGEPVERRRARDAVAVGRQRERRELVGHQDQDVGSRVRHRRSWGNRCSNGTARRCCSDAAGMTDAAARSAARSGRDWLESRQAARRRAVQCTISRPNPRGKTSGSYGAIREAYVEIRIVTVDAGAARVRIGRASAELHGRRARARLDAAGREPAGVPAGSGAGRAAVRAQPARRHADERRPVPVQSRAREPRDAARRDRDAARAPRARRADDRHRRRFRDLLADAAPGRAETRDAGRRRARRHVTGLRRAARSRGHRDPVRRRPLAVVHGRAALSRSGHARLRAGVPCGARARRAARTPARAATAARAADAPGALAVVGRLVRRARPRRASRRARRDLQQLCAGDPRGAARRRRRARLVAARRRAGRVRATGETRRRAGRHVARLLPGAAAATARNRRDPRVPALAARRVRNGVTRRARSRMGAAALARRYQPHGGLVLSAA